MSPVDALLKSLRREQLFASLFTAACYFTAVILMVAAEQELLRPIVRQFAILCFIAGLIGVSHSLLSIRLQTVVTTLGTRSTAPERE